MESKSSLGIEGFVYVSVDETNCQWRRMWMALDRATLVLYDLNSNIVQTVLLSRLLKIDRSNNSTHCLRLTTTSDVLSLSFSSQQELRRWRDHFSSYGTLDSVELQTTEGRDAPQSVPGYDPSQADTGMPFPGLSSDYTGHRSEQDHDDLSDVLHFYAQSSGIFSGANCIDADSQEYHHHQLDTPEHTYLSVSSPAGRSDATSTCQPLTGRTRSNTDGTARQPTLLSLSSPADQADGTSTGQPITGRKRSNTEGTTPRRPFAAASIIKARSWSQLFVPKRTLRKERSNNQLRQDRPAPESEPDMKSFLPLRKSHLRSLSGQSSLRAQPRSADSRPGSPDFYRGEGELRAIARPSNQRTLTVAQSDQRKVHHRPPPLHGVPRRPDMWREPDGSYRPFPRPQRSPSLGSLTFHANIQRHDDALLSPLHPPVLPFADRDSRAPTRQLFKSSSLDSMTTSVRWKRSAHLRGHAPALSSNADYLLGSPPLDSVPDLDDAQTPISDSSLSSPSNHSRHSSRWPSLDATTRADAPTSHPPRVARAAHSGLHMPAPSRPTRAPVGLGYRPSHEDLRSRARAQGPPHPVVVVPPDSDASAAITNTYTALKPDDWSGFHVYEPQKEPGGPFSSLYPYGTSTNLPTAATKRRLASSRARSSSKAGGYNMFSGRFESTNSADTHSSKSVRYHWETLAMKPWSAESQPEDSAALEVRSAGTPTSDDAPPELLRPPSPVATRPRSSTALGIPDEQVRKGAGGRRVDQEAADALVPHDLTGEVHKCSGFATAHGGFADVWMGEWRRPGGTTKVAVKVLRALFLDDPESDKKIRRRLRRELRAWQHLRHRHILALCGTCADFGPYPAMVSPWLANGNAVRYLRSRTPPADAYMRLKLLCEAAEGLHYLHSIATPVIHGDLNGGNILVNDSGEACLCDFGLSSIIEVASGASMTSTFAGSVRWMAPELFSSDTDASGRPPQVSVHTDIYSFGSVALELLTGNVPYYQVKSDAQVVIEISRGIKPQRPLDSATSLTDDQWDYIQWCWAEKPEDRPEIADVLKDFRHFRHEALCVSTYR